MSTHKKARFNALTLRITPATVDALPGYDGDARVYWETSKVENQQEAIEITLSGLKLLRDFWVGQHDELPLGKPMHLYS